MSKYYAKYDELCHHFFYNETDAHSPNNRMFIEDNIIYSYGRHFPIAIKEIVKNKNYLFVNTCKYSQTTSSHQNIFESTIPHRQYKVIYLNLYNNRLDNINSVFKYFLNQIEELQLKYNHSRLYKEDIKNTINETLSNCKLYIEYLKDKKIPYKNKLPKALKQLLDGVDLSYENLIEEREKERIRENKKKIRKDKEKYKEQLSILEEWKKGVGDRPDLPLIKNAHLRINGEYVETSQGCRVSIESARILARLIQAKKDIRGHDIDGYTVISINGTLKIGCHDIEISEVDRMIKLLLI